MQKETWLQAAKSYLEAGYSIVPIKHKDKAPSIRWQPLTEKAAPWSRVMEWANRWPVNLGIITGAVSGLVVVDIDSAKGGDPAPILAQYPTDLVVRTGSGGWHLYYTYTEDFAGNQVNLLPGVDIRSNGGLVVAPPSLHASGGTYEWVKSGSPGKLGPLGKVSKNPRTVEVEDEEDELELDTADADRNWLSRDSREGVNEGGRNDTLAKHAGYMAGKGFALDYALEQCRIFNEAKFDPPLSDEEVETTVRSVYRTESKKQKEKEKTKEKLSKPLVFTQLQSFLAKNIDDAPMWDIEEWLPRSTVAFAVAPPGSYKTWFTFDLALSVATGQPFLGSYPVQRQGPVLLVQQEDHASQSAERLALITEAKMLPEGGDADTLFACSTIPLYIHTEREVKFDDPEQVALLTAIIEELQPVLVIVDPLYSTVDRLDDAYFDEAVQHLFALKNLRDKYGTSFMLVHHTKKTRGGGRARDEMYGSAFLNAFLETGWQLRPYEDSTVSCYRHFKRSANTKDELFKFDIQTKTWPYKYSVQLEGERPEEEDPGKVKRGKKVDLEDAPKVSKPAFKVSPAELLFQFKEPANPKTVAKALKLKPTDLYPVLQELVAEGSLVYDAVEDVYRKANDE